MSLAPGIKLGPYEILSKLERIDVGGGPVIQLATDLDPRGGSWNEDGVIIFTGDSYGPVSQIAADGGAVTAATVLDTTSSEATHRYPHFLPDGRHFIYLARRAGAGAGEKPTIFVGEPGSNERTPILEVASNVVYASGHLLYVRGGVLVAQRFDPGKLVVTGPAVPLVDDARMDERFSRGVFAVSANGVLVCMTGSNQTRTQLRWLDRSGKSLGDVGEPEGRSPVGVATGGSYSIWIRKTISSRSQWNIPQPVSRRERRDVCFSSTAREAHGVTTSRWTAIDSW